MKLGKPMLKNFKKIGKKAKKVASVTAVLVGDLNGDGKVDEEDAMIAAQWAKKAVSTIGSEASKLGKKAIRSDLVTDAASGAAIGAVAAVPVPVLGPMAGAAIGAGVGIFKNLTKKERQEAVAKNVYDELLKLAELREKNIISEDEFEAQKKKLLDLR
ncbi:SHOCT domain-containing protein [Thiovibrio sp. JS02]